MPRKAISACLRAAFCLILTAELIPFLFSGCSGPKYNITYDLGQGTFDGAKAAYRAGAQVTVYFDRIATDTDYYFYLDDAPIEWGWDEKKGFVLTFTMPDHDAHLRVEARNSMINDNDTVITAGATLSFESFDGGGPEFDIEIEDPSVLEYRSERRYADRNHEMMTGSAYQVIFGFTGRKEGSTKFTISARSPIADNFDAVYLAEVDDALNVSLTELEIRDIEN